MIVTFTKAFRCVANESRITAIDPMAAMTGKTVFSDEFYSHAFETSDSSEMRSYVEEEGIIYSPPEDELSPDDD